MSERQQQGVRRGTNKGRDGLAPRKILLFSVPVSLTEFTGKVRIIGTHIKVAMTA
jgi:hypothetical protein